jgi:hypothetical protein
MTTLLSNLVSAGEPYPGEPHPGEPYPGEPHFAATQYLVSHGNSGGFGRFVTTLSLRRGDRIVAQTARGLELGTVLCPASHGHLQLLAATSAGRIVRRAEPADDEMVRSLQLLGRGIFDAAQQMTHDAALALEIVDVQILLDGATAIIQFLGKTPDDCETVARALERKFGLTIVMENLTLTAPTAEEEQQHGCGKPDCGRVGGGCMSCGTDGGCSSCGSGKVDMAAYFLHLRSKVEQRLRTPLL